MVRLLAILLLFALCAFAHRPDNNTTPYPAFTPKQLNEDFEILVKTLIEAHPELYRVNSMSAINKRLAHIREEIKTKKTYLEFLTLIAPLFTEIGCISTQWGHSADFIRYRNENIPLLPIKIKIESGRFFIDENFSSDSTLGSGIEIMKFNGESPSHYLKKNYGLLPTDGRIKSIQHRWLEKYFPNHHSNFWERPSFFNLELKHPDGTLFRRSVSALLKKDFKTSPTVANEPSPFYFSGKYAVLTPSAVVNKNETELTRFLDSCFNLIQNQQAKSVILNLKGNAGSDPLWGKILYRYLASDTFIFTYHVQTRDPFFFTYREHLQDDAGLPSQYFSLVNATPCASNAFHGKLYVITDGWTIGTSGYLCALLWERPMTLFAGEDCGTSLYGMNFFPISLNLPHTGLKISIPIAQIRSREKYYYSTHGVKVKFPFEISDPGAAVNKVIEMIEATNKK